MSSKITKRARKTEGRNAAYHASLKSGIDMGNGYVGGYPQFTINPNTGECRKTSPGIPWVNTAKYI